MKRIAIITSEGCVPCRMLKYELSKREIPFDSYDENSLNAEHLLNLTTEMASPITFLLEQNPLGVTHEVVAGYSMEKLQKILDWWSE